jgi:hypothetical protein
LDASIKAHEYPFPENSPKEERRTLLIALMACYQKRCCRASSKAFFTVELVDRPFL